ncbi:velvet factor [Polychytrium aggregatum]|uniref:velvet factor n=1 Tax=Polychytrium aggregatum TaxID=110093 RepID=UPI0022FE9B46|nr:velvet factor [Polychytrium aggregatum]KAI9208110.1 velvet factor [Polychytrium aggregatum]
MYVLKIIEQPQKVRCSGFGDRLFGRPIDPAPILQLLRQNPDGTRTSNSSVLTEASTFVVHTQLFSADGTMNQSQVVNPAKLKEAVPLRPRPYMYRLSRSTSPIVPEPESGQTATLTNVSGPSEAVTTESLKRGSDSAGISPFDDQRQHGCSLEHTGKKQKRDASSPIASSSLSSPTLQDDRSTNDHRPDSATRTSTESPARAVGWNDDDYRMRELLPYSQFSLFGHLVAPSTFARDINGSDTGVYFIFGNISIRIEGRFRLKFILIDLREPR